jgi:mRNA-degrading endonuclease RelE of RelBE toxin-antitoxin system
VARKGRVEYDGGVGDGSPAEALEVASQYTIDVTRTAYGHLAALKRYDRNRILDGIKEQLSHQPEQETRNKKRLRDNPISDWELRIDPFRILYEVDETNQCVTVVGVGVKERDRLIIGGEEVEI